MKKKTFSSSITNFIKSIDYFAVTFEFRIDKKPRYGSVTGGSSYILYLIFALIFFTKSFSDYISFSEAKIIYIDKSAEPSPALNYKKLNFTYAIQISFENETSVLNSSFANLFSISHSFVFHNRTENSKRKVQSFPRSCAEKDFNGMADKFPLFKRFKVDQFVCFDFYENFTLQGVYTDEFMSYAEILLELNPEYFKNKQNFEKDKNYENYEKEIVNISDFNISQVLSKIFDNNLFKFTLFYLDTYSDASDKNKPLFYKLDSIYTYLDLYYFKRHNIFFQQFNYSEDNNLFYINYKTFSSMKVHSIQNVDLPIDNRINSSLEQKNFLSKFIIRSINNQKLIKVSYIKIPEFLASLSGLLINSLLILKYFMFLFNNLEAKQNIISKIMKYKDIIKANNKKTSEYVSKKFDDERFRHRRLSRLSHFTSSNDCDGDNNKSNSKNPFVKKHSSLNLENKVALDNELDFCRKFPNSIGQFESVISTTRANNKNIIISQENDEKKDVSFIINTTDSINDNEANLKQKLLPFSNNNNKNDKISEIEKQKSKQNLIIIKEKNEEKNTNIETENDLKSHNNNNSDHYNHNQRNPYEIYPTDIISRLICCKVCKSNKKHLIFENAERKFDHNLDMVTYMKKMQELDIIKYLLLDKNTLQLVNFISKPCVSLSSKSIEDSEYKLFFETIDDKNSLSYRNIDDVKKCYDCVLAKKDKSFLETRIIQLFDIQIEEIIN